MADDWKPGDLALCVNAGVIVSWAAEHTGVGLVKGRVYTVDGMGECDLSGLLILFFKDKPDPALASRFRKIRPHTPDAEDAETIALLNGKRVGEGQHA